MRHEQAARAKDIGEPRQIALCAINLWRLRREQSETERASRTKMTARAELKALLLGREGWVAASCACADRFFGGLSATHRPLGALA